MRTSCLLQNRWWSQQQQQTADNQIDPRKFHKRKIGLLPLPSLGANNIDSTKMDDEYGREVFYLYVQCVHFYPEALMAKEIVILAV